MEDLKLFDLEYTGSNPPEAAIIVDAATAGNPGLSKYKGILYPSKQVIFEKNIGYATNNIAEFIALIHALAYRKNMKLDLPVYSDSKVALAWMKNGVNTSLKPTPQSKVACELLKRAKQFREGIHVKENIDYFLWETSAWGENPADYGNK